jgi:hypothetical protein
MPVSPDAGDLPEMRRGSAYGGSLAARAKELNRRVGFAAVRRADFSIIGAACRADQHGLAIPDPRDRRLKRRLDIVGVLDRAFRLTAHHLACIGVGYRADGVGTHPRRPLRLRDW